MRPDEFLKAQLSGAFARQRRFRFWSDLAACWAVTTLAGFFLLVLERQSGWGLSYAPVLLAALIIGVHRARRLPDWRELAREIEKRRPQLDGRLLTAVQQRAESGAALNYLQQRLIEEALQDARENSWAATIPTSRVALAR